MELTQKDINILKNGFEEMPCYKCKNKDMWTCMCSTFEDFRRKYIEYKKSELKILEDAINDYKTLLERKDKLGKQVEKAKGVLCEVISENLLNEILKVAK